jgi:type II secretory pathway component PulF
VIRIRSILYSEKLEDTLKRAGLNYTSVSFLRLCLIGSMIVAVSFTGFAVLLRIKRSFPVTYLLVIFLITFFIIFQLLKSIPSFSLQNKKAFLEADLLYSARHLLLKLESGSSLVNSIESVSVLKTNSSIFFKELMYDISLGLPVEDAIKKSSEISPSPAYSKILEEISTSLKTGADLNKTLRSTIDDVTRKHLIQIQEYGKKLNPMSMFYMIFGTILPSLGTAMLVVISSFLPGMIIIDKRILLGAAVVVLLAQVFFVLAFKSLKPAVVE